jgi:uncharacterized membrane protein
MAMAATFAEWTFDPLKFWPFQHWSDGERLTVLLAVVLTVAALTVWTYAGSRAGLRRTLAVLALRLGALLVACLVVLRPSYADRDEAVVPSKLLIVVDSSASMNITDELNGLSRWDNARRILKAPAVESLLRRLQRQQKVEIVWYQGAEDVAKFDPAGKATGKRTDVGRWLNSLLKAHGGEQNLRGLLILSDGADNGTRFPAVEEARKWRGVPCPIHTFALGSPTTAPNQRDVVVTDIIPDPPVVPVKNKLTVKAKINLYGFDRQTLDIHLLVNGKKVSRTRADLHKTVDNEVVVGEFRPEAAGEIKVGVEVERVQDEITTLNNIMETYVTVTNEGVSVLWVENKPRAWEPVFAIGALTSDKRFSVFPTERRDDGRGPDRADWFNFEKKHYDVIVIGDISAEKFARGNGGVFAQIRKMVEENGTGLLMLGGYQTFGNKDWQNVRPIAEILPVRPLGEGQIKGEIRLKATPPGLAYAMRLSDGDPQHVWRDVFQPLQGMANIGPKRPDAEVFLEEDGLERRPVIVATAAGKGRTMAFAADTTWKAWRRPTPDFKADAIKAYERFWRQVILWLAKREDAAGNVWVLPDVRRVAAGNSNPVGFRVGARGKGGLPVPNARFTVKVIGPNKAETVVPTAQQNEQERGFFYQTNEPGEYVIEVTAKDAAGADLGPPGRSKFLCYAEDLEYLRPAADHKFLKELAAAGAGTAYPGGEDKVVEYLEGLLAQPLLPSRSRAERWPDWDRTPVSNSLGEEVAVLWSSGMLACFLAFVALLSAEWYLRRRWGMV